MEEHAIQEYSVLQQYLSNPPSHLGAMNIKTLIFAALITFVFSGCTSIERENEKVNTLVNHNVHKGDSKSDVINKIGQPLMMQELNGVEMWTYSHSNESALVSPRMFIPVVGIIASAHAMDQSGGYQNVNLTVTFNGQGRVSSVDINKTSVRMTKF